MARNALFQGLAARAAAGALAALPPSLATLAGEASGDAGALQAAAALASAPLPGGHPSGGAPCTVGEGVAGVIAQVRENMVLRRAAALGGQGCLVVPYVHNSPAPGLGSIGVLVALRRKPSAAAAEAAAAEAPLASTPALLSLGRRLAMHIAAASPTYLARAAVPQAVVERERGIVAAASEKDLAGKPPAIAAKILEGKLGKFYGECVLLEQAFALGEEGWRVGRFLEEEGKKCGGVEVAGFACFRVGAGGGSGNAPASASQT